MKLPRRMKLAFLFDGEGVKKENTSCCLTKETRQQCLGARQRIAALRPVRRMLARTAVLGTAPGPIVASSKKLPSWRSDHFDAEQHVQENSSHDQLIACRA